MINISESEGEQRFYFTAVNEKSIIIEFKIVYLSQDLHLKREETRLIQFSF